MSKKSINKKEQDKLKAFTFPEHNLVIKAKNIDEALKKAQKLLSK